MEKAVFVQILEQIVGGFEDARFRAAYAEAKAAGNVPGLMELVMAVQTRAFASQGLTQSTGVGLFKEAGRTYGLDADVAPQLARMKAALGQ